MPHGHVTALVALALFAGCSTLPRGAALRTEVVNVQAAAPLPGQPAVTQDFAVSAVSRETLGILSQWPRTGEPGYSWIRRQEQPASLLIAPGDTLSIVVWDAEQNSLLAPPGQRVAELQDVVVSSDGRIFLPFVGDLRVAGMSASSAREHIQERYTETIPSVQVQLNLTAGRANTANLVAGVARPGVYPLADRDVTLLTLLSLGGGVPPSLNNPQVRLFRGNDVYGVGLNRLYEDPGLDTTLQGGDRVIVAADDRYFLSLGATQSESRHLFPQDRVTALDALSITGGITDNRADPQGILVLRRYPQTAVHPVVPQEGAEGGPAALPSPEGPPHAQMIFTLDLTSADGLFSASQFEIMSGDVVYATESPVSAAQTVLTFTALALGVAAAVF